MAREYLSAGVYTEVHDRSFLQSAQPMGPASVFVGAFTKGTALIPTRIKDTKDLINTMGQPNGQFYAQYAAYQYSKHKGDFLVQRILWNDQWKSNVYAIYGKTGEQKTILSILISTQKDYNISTITSSTKPAQATEYSNLKFSLTTGTGEGIVTHANYDLSIDKIINIEDTIGVNPKQNKELYVFANLIEKDVVLDYTEISIEKMEDFINIDTGYSSARTPWIYNENNDKLFYFNHLSDGTYTNRDIKIAIQNINTKGAWTKFDVFVRDYNDTYKKPGILQAFYSVDLNPVSDRYIAKIIGDGWAQYRNKRTYSNGDYPNKSNYIRVVTSDLVKSMDVSKNANINVIGSTPMLGQSNTTIEASFPTLYTTTSQVDGKQITHYGYDVGLNNIKFLSNPINSVYGWDKIDEVDKKHEVGGNFIIPFAGGFDGRNPSEVLSDQNINGFDFKFNQNEQQYIPNGYASFKLAVDLLKNKQEYDIDTISIPGISIQEPGKLKLYKYMIQNIANVRQDVLIPVDASSLLQDNIQIVVNAIISADIDSSFGACYYPSVKIECPFTKRLPMVPASTFIPAVLAYTQLVSQPHYAPAGINRGVLNVLQPLIKLDKEDRDLLYKNKINPIVSFVNNGTVVWGQKTLQEKSSALDRVNVRVLINRIIKWINDYGKRVLFENNTSTLRTIFTIGVEKYMNSVVASNGLYGYNFIMDGSNNTADIIDRNQLVGQLSVKPAETAEAIIIPINILRSDDQF